MKLWQKILLAIAIGTTTGIFLGEYALYLKPVGTIFLNLLKMLVVPLMFSSMISGITHMTDTRKLGRVGLMASKHRRLLFTMATNMELCG